MAVEDLHEKQTGDRLGNAWIRKKWILWGTYTEELRNHPVCQSDQWDEKTGLPRF